MTRRRRSRLPGLFLLAFFTIQGLSPLVLAQDAPEDAQPPTVSFTVSPSTPQPGANVTGNARFTARAFAPCQPVTLYEWDWDGDGAFEVNGTSPTSRHAFADGGAYTVTLRVTDACGQTASASRNVTVQELEDEGLQFGVIWEYRASFLRAAFLVLWLSVVAIVAGLPLGILVGLARISPFAPLRWVAGVYIEFLRGTPLLVQIFIVWLALPAIHPALKFSTLTSGLIALVINSSAYQAEIIRSGIQAIPHGQTEAALGMGLSRAQTMRHVILPQALRLVIPPLTNEFIILIKDTSLLSVIGVIELLGTARLISTRTFLLAEPFIAIAVIYFAMTYSLSLLLRYLERRLAIPGLGVKTGGGAH